MKNKLIFYTLSILMLFSLCSCSVSDSTAPEASTSAKESTKTVSIPDEIHKKISDFVSIDADVTVPEELSQLTMKKVEAHRPELDENTAKEIFFKNVTIKKKETDPDYKCREFGKYTMNYYYGSKGKTLSYEKANLFFSSDKIDHLLNCINDDPQFPSYNLDKYSTTKDLPFAKRKDVFRIIKQTYQKLGIEISDSYEAYALDHKTLKKEENPTDTDGNVMESSRKESWTQDDDTYYFILHQEADGVPIRELAYGEDPYKGTGIDQTELTCYYDKDGWVDFRLSWAYILDETNENVSILDVDSALKSLKKKCSMLSTDEKWDITSLDLELIPVFIKDNDYEIHPVWSFKGKSTMIDTSNGGTPGYDLEILFDAITGKEIVI